VAQWQRNRLLTDWLEVRILPGQQSLTVPKVGKRSVKPSHLHAWFDSKVRHAGCLTQLVRVPGLHPGCRGFESLSIHAVAGSSNGRTTDFGSVYLGSNPSPAAKPKYPNGRGRRLKISSVWVRIPLWVR
jgi:hypothetical protein